MGALLFVVFVVVPIAELAVIITVGQHIGVWWTVGLLLASAAVGSWLLRREGRRTWRALQAALAAGRLPTREVADGALVIVGAALMVAPGFITDVAGMLCLFPPTRSMLRGLLSTALVRRLLVGGGSSRRAPFGRWQAERPSPADPRIIDGEVEP
ncbi:MAG: FxsA family protein [Pseudonocardiales bacterium]